MTSEAVSDIEECTIGDLTVQVDRLLCVGFGDCIDLAPDAFEFDDEGIATLRDGASETDRQRLLDACECCPVDALIVLDEEGRQVVP